MAVTASARNAGSSTTVGAAERRLVYGLNVALTSVLALLAVALAIWAAGRFDRRTDWSGSGANSLAPRTVKLLRGLEEDVKITAVYSTALKEVRKFDEARRNRVEDLLGLYEGAGRPRITARMLDPRRDEPRVRDLLRSILDKPAHREQIAPHRAALEAFPPINQEIVDLIQAERGEIERLLQADTALARVNQIVAIRVGLDRLLKDAGSTANAIQRAQEGDLPRFGEATAVVRDFLSAVQTTLQQVGGWAAVNGASLPGISPESKAFLAHRQDAYAPPLARIGDVLTQLSVLEPPKFEELTEKLDRGQAIVVETPGAAEVLSFEDVWPFPTSERPTPPDVDPRQFAGEQAISSAILRLTQKERTAVVFVRAGGEPLLRPDFSNMNPMMMQQMPRAPFGGLAEQLAQQNFITAEWDVAAEPNPPAPEGAARTVYVVFPPAPPRQNPMMPMSPRGLTDEQKLAIENAIETSGKAIFLAGWSTPNAGRYAFEDYLRSTWQIGVKSDFLVVEYVPRADKPGRWWPMHRDLPLITTDVSRFTDHPIGRPLQSQPGAFYLVCPLQNLALAATQPTGVEVAAIAEIPRNENCWASADFMRVFQEELQSSLGTVAKPEDLPTPFPIALSAQRGDRRIVVIASERFASDDFAMATGIRLTTAGLVTYPLYPANSDLFINALHWLTGDAGRIAVGARSGDVPRLDRLKPGPMVTAWRIFLVGIWPGMILLIGGSVWMLRRR